MLRATVIDIGAKVVRHGRYVIFQMAEVEAPRELFQEIPRFIAGLQAAPALARAQRHRGFDPVPVPSCWMPPQWCLGLAIETGASYPALRSRQPGPIEAEFLADPAQVARIDILARTTQRRLRCPPFSMHRHHNRTLATLVMLLPVEAAPLLRQPFPKCSAFHDRTPVHDMIWPVYGADWIRSLVNQQGAWANIPPRRDRKEPTCFTPNLYRARNLVERFFNKIKQCRRIATRYDKLAANYLAFIKLASIRLWLRALMSPRPEGWFTSPGDST